MVWSHYRLIVKCSVKKQQKLFNIFFFNFSTCIFKVEDIIIFVHVFPKAIRQKRLQINQASTCSGNDGLALWMKNWEELPIITARVGKIWINFNLWSSLISIVLLWGSLWLESGHSHSWHLDMFYNVKLYFWTFCC